MDTGNISLRIAPECEGTDAARMLRARFGDAVSGDGHILQLDTDGLFLMADGQTLRGDYTHMLPRLRAGRLGGELLVRAAKIKGADRMLRAFDATAGLGEDSLLLAAAGFHVTLYERNPVVFALLADTLRRAVQMPELTEIVARMDAREGDSMAAMAALPTPPDVILLDPMFPERQKSALVKKKLQIIQKLEQPCDSERELLLTAMRAGPQKLIVKRPPKGEHLAGIRPDYTLEGKAVRFDCFASPRERIGKYEE